MTRYVKRACFLLCLSVVISACGYKGPLILPQDAEKNEAGEAPASEDAQDQRENS